MVGRILRSADFQRVLATPPRSRSAHFSAHHVAACPSVPAKPVKRAASTELSTGDAPSCPPPVDDSPANSLPRPPDGPASVAQAATPIGRWLGLVVPKRHAKRAVTRNLLKRQMRAVMRSLAGSLPPGLWVLRLKAPFDRQQFISPASVPLLQAAREELQQLLQRAVQPRAAPSRR